MHTYELNGKTITVQEREDWTTSIDENFKPGDYFDEDIAWDLIECVPPHRLSFNPGYFQCGEPNDHMKGPDGKYHATYLTLVKVNQEPEIWQFKGYCFTDQEEEPCLK